MKVHNKSQWFCFCSTPQNTCSLVVFTQSESFYGTFGRFCSTMIILRENREKRRHNLWDTISWVNSKRWATWGNQTLRNKTLLKARDWRCSGYPTIPKSLMEKRYQRRWLTTTFINKHMRLWNDLEKNGRMLSSYMSLYAYFMWSPENWGMGKA